MSDKSQQNDDCPEGMVKNKHGQCVMPDVTFPSLILSLNTTALFHMGELPHPETGEKLVDLDLAKNSIDTLALLQEKTQGNLDNDETQLLTNILYELKLRFVKATSSSS